MSKNDNEIGIVDAYIVAKHGLRVKIARAGENGSSRMNHHRHAVGLSAFVNGSQAAIAVHVVIWREGLVGRMKLDGANPEFRKPVDFNARVGDCSWKHAAKGDEPVRRCLAILCAPVVDFWRESYDLRGDVID